jgi:endonuclease YncB( thermonuclease family)
MHEREGKSNRSELASPMLGRLWVTAVFCLIFVLWFQGIVYAGLLEGKVVSVHDGDTITLLDATQRQHKIRLAGIDAPELSQAFGRVSRQHLADQVAGRTVVIEWTKRDKYQRLVGKVLLDGRDINITLIEAGLAWHYKKYATEQSPEDRQRYARAEERARTTRLGLWQDSHPVPPWAYRKAKKP